MCGPCAPVVQQKVDEPGGMRLSAAGQVDQARSGVGSVALVVAFPLSQQLGWRYPVAAAEVTTEYRQTAEAIALGNASHRVVGRWIQQIMTSLLKTLLPHPLNRTTAEALLKGQLQVAAGVATALFELAELDRGVKICPRPLQQILENLLAATPGCWFILNDLAEIRAQQ